MAFYQDMNKKTRGEKRQKAEARGGFEDEGSRYGGRRGDRPGYGEGRPQNGGFGGPRQGRPASGEGRPQGSRFGGPRDNRNNDRPGYGEGRPQGSRFGGPRDNRGADRPQNGGFGGPRQGRPASGEGRPQGNRFGGPRDNRSSDRPGYGEGRPQGNRFGGPRDNRSSDRPGYGEGRPQGNRFGGPRDNRSSDRPGYGEGRPQGRPAYDEGRSGFAPDSRPTSFRDRPRVAPPRGERAPIEQAGPRDFKKSGNYRFSKGEPTRYDDRGAGVTPPSYDQQRRLREQEEPRYASSRYRGPVAYQVDGEGVEQDVVPNENLLSGRNPIREALKSGRDIEKLLVARGELSGSAREIVAIAKERHIPVQEVDRSRLDDITHNHQGMLAFASAYQYSTLEQMLALAQERNEPPFLILLDGVTDPHNLGAIIRTAECAGAHGVIVQERRAVGLTPAAVKASAGAIEYVPVARVTNLSNTIESLKQKNVWVYAADMEGEDYAQEPFQGAVALVIGAEGEGVGRRVAESCDKTLSIPLKGKLDSLNASVAAGILMYAVARARG